MRKILSWAFYDFANTIFSAIVLTAYFPLYLSSLAPANWYLGAATTSAMLLAGAVVPFWGALSDSTGKTRSYLFKSTLACIFFLVPLAFFKTPASLIPPFVLSCFFYHASLVFYHALLPMAAPPEKQGFVSGLGTGLGYLGVVVSLPIANVVEKKFGTPPVFLLAAALFFIFSLPVFIFVPERGTRNPEPFRWGLWKEEWKKILELVRRLKDRKDFMFFLLGNFFAVEALNATIFWFAVYAKKVFSAPPGTLIMMLMAVNASAFFMGIIAGFLTGRWGAMKVMVLSAAALAGTLIVMSLVPNFTLFLAAAVLGGAFSIAGIWTAGRKLALEFSPPEETGAYCGLYNLTTKVSVIANLVFSLVADKAGFRIAIFTLTVPALAGFFFIRASGRERQRAL